MYTIDSATQLRKRNPKNGTSHLQTSLNTAAGPRSARICGCRHILEFCVTCAVLVEKRYAAIAFSCAPCH